MTAATFLADLRAAAVRWSRLVAALLWHDPIFRYATIAAVVALFFLVAHLVQDFAGPGVIPKVEQTTSQESAVSGRTDESNDAGGASETSETPPRPGSVTTLRAPGDTLPVKIAPGRTLDNIEVEPPPGDSFGTLPKGATRQ